MKLQYFEPCCRHVAPSGESHRLASQVLLLRRALEDVWFFLVWKALGESFSSFSRR